MEGLVFGIQWGTGRVLRKEDEIYGYYENQKKAHDVMKELKRMHRSIKFGIIPMRVHSIRVHDDGRRYSALLKRDVDAGYSRERIIEI